MYVLFWAQLHVGSRILGDFALAIPALGHLILAGGAKSPAGAS